ncbi:MAG TPA: hypothetical protein VHM25_05185 [Polyangiaceae bacterium]|nr:hypothetical protein [Polyangiaceae bacterium]
MKSSILGCAVWLTSSLLAACGGVSNIGSSDGGSSNPGVGGFEPFGGSNAAAGSGATTDPKGGYSAGAASGMGATGKGGATGRGGTTSAGGATGRGGTTSAGGISAGGATSVRLCKYDIECLGFGDECQPCADGGYACDSFCVNGACVSKPAGCPSTCASDAECVVHDSACVSCDDGEHCPTSTCQMGVCRSSKPVCGIPDNCVGYTCGYPCKLCDAANGCTEDYTAFCNGEGVCQAGPTNCGSTKCMSNSDCGAPPPTCSPCGDGSCATFGCFDNECKLSCTGAPPICKYAEECASLGTECKLCPSGKCAVPACIQNGCALVCPL